MFWYLEYILFVFVFHVFYVLLPSLCPTTFTPFYKAFTVSLRSWNLLHDFIWTSTLMVENSLALSDPRRPIYLVKSWFPAGSSWIDRKITKTRQRRNWKFFHSRWCCLHIFIHTNKPQHFFCWNQVYINFRYSSTKLGSFSCCLLFDKIQYTHTRMPNAIQTCMCVCPFHKVPLN